jgi:MerR family redox-sensitive transcriptional activator SoxR
VSVSLLPIDRVAESAAVSASALRYYESRGLIAAGVRIGGRRHYAPAVLHRLSVIRTLRIIGFTLADIERLLTPAGEWRGAIAARRGQVEEQIRQLRALVAALDADLA